MLFLRPCSLARPIDVDLDVEKIKAKKRTNIELVKKKE